MGTTTERGRKPLQPRVLQMTHRAASAAPSILKPPPGSGKPLSRKGPSAPPARNTTLAHQPMGQTGWLQGNTFAEWERQTTADDAPESSPEPSPEPTPRPAAPLLSDGEVRALLNLLDDEARPASPAEDVASEPAEDDDADESTSGASEESGASSTQTLLRRLHKSRGVSVDLYDAISRRMFALEIERGRLLSQLRQWAAATTELRALFDRRERRRGAEESDAAAASQALATERRRREDAEAVLAESEAAAIASRSRETALASRCAELEAELARRETQLEESQANCGRLRAALIDAELEIERQGSAPLPASAASSVLPSQAEAYLALRADDTRKGPRHPSQSDA